MKAMKKVIADKRKVEDDYKEVAQKLGTATRNIVELEEELKVTNDICEALEIDHEEKEGLELARKKEQEKYVVSIENDDEDLVEDESTGELHPTKVAKILEVHQTPASEANNACKKCDKIISNKEGLFNHMKSHMRDEKIMLKCDHCDFESHQSDKLLNHISETHVKFLHCLTCKKTFVSKEDLVTHAVKDHPLKNKVSNKHECSVCGEHFDSLELLISIF